MQIKLRKNIQSSDGVLVVGLPIAWLKEQMLGHGDLVEVEVNDDIIVIRKVKR